MYKSDLIIREPKKPLINRVIVAFLYASLLSYIVYLFLYKDFLNHPQKWTITIYLILLICILFLSSIRSIAIHNIHLNFEKKKIKHQYQIGVFNYKETWQDLIDLEYVSVFKTGSYFQINLWYQKNKILNLMILENYDESIKNGYLIAEKLQIDLLDASVKGNHQWVNKDTYQETGEIQYS
ncbi:hypothetical protein D7030_05900 [Flavobacteriaceae bacterium AU392]|nr:hypothetical protein D1817_02520 [Flavobacteriaceae bacterium]RKM84665.1 hypothetical protein D7030_05900 [Flavobacteriaceae bacterium AU392]